MKRKQVFDQVENLLQTYCQGCLLKATFRKEYGKAYAHKFCITQCTVGEQLKKCGEQLAE
ncbi:zinc-finger domain-containing protein [Bacillus xiapuensis]|uniref:zinc-finger domain-containing protein n=1 Tax=Bacillus xiapuensis TaxID=2014075 RepID=UPI000C243571|nr:zinc-finger domain-containing protein [Bacillus xiapuensis]